MAERTAIAWTDHTFNTHVGCQEASPGCDHCYAREWANRYERWRGLWGRPALTPRRRTSAAYWRTPFAWEREAIADGRQHRVFCNSLSDIFEAHPELDPIRADLWALIGQTPHLDWLLLTKRPEQIGRLLPVEWLEHPGENVWLGTSTETQRWADIRIPRLLAVPAVVHFVSAEPLLGPLELERHLGPREVNWVITGGESGTGFRPMDLDWVRSIRDQCARAGAAFFHKQGAHRYPGRDVELDGRIEHAWPQLGAA
jgi:protein gp37